MIFIALSMVFIIRRNPRRDISSPTLSEVENVQGKIKDFKAPGTDNITGQLLKYVFTTLAEYCKSFLIKRKSNTQ